MNDLCDSKKRILRYIWPHRIATLIFDIHKNLCMNMTLCNECPVSNFPFSPQKCLATKVQCPVSIAVADRA